MQSIKHQTNYSYIHPIFEEIEQLYSALSEKLQNKSFLESFDKSLKSLQDIFNSYGTCEYDLAFSDKQYKPLETPKFDDNNIIVCFSGGKDSMATALYYKAHGYNVYLYHLKGINKVYNDEHKQAQIIAEKLGMPLIVGNISLSGRHDYIEHPLKNMIIANCALQYGIQAGISDKIAFGCFTTAHLEDNPFDICGGDCVEMWQEYEHIIQIALPGFKMFECIENYHQSFGALKANPELLPFTISCMSPYRYRAYYKKRNEDKYKINLPDNRCGSCWKCCAEYIYFTDNNIYEFNKEYYKHCLEVLYRNSKKEGVKFNNITDLWQEYFFYPIEDSKLYEDILNAKLSANDIAFDQ